MVHLMTVRPYRPEDQEACLQMFQSNVPKFFTQEEEEEFERYLTGLSEPYFVVQTGDELVACGGVFVRADGRTAGLAWGLVKASAHRQGHGRRLLWARLQWLAAHAPEVTTVSIDTSQHSAPFYARLGFQTVQVQPDFYAAGLDRYDMTLHLPAT